MRERERERENEKTKYIYIVEEIERSDYLPLAVFIEISVARHLWDTERSGLR